MYTCKSSSFIKAKLTFLIPKRWLTSGPSRDPTVVGHEAEYPSLNVFYINTTLSRLYSHSREVQVSLSPVTEDELGLREVTLLAKEQTTKSNRFPLLLTPEPVFVFFSK